MDGPKPARRRPAKLFHKKSRTGCQTCRTRRVKCDEAKPVCSHCSRLELACAYDRPTSPGNQPAECEHQVSPDIIDPPESEARRRLELRLLYQYVTETGPSLAVDELSRKYWITILCEKVFQSNALLYAILMISALHTEKRSNSSDQEAVQNCRTYLNMAIREHHKEMAQMSQDNVDMICLTSSMLRLYSFVRLQDRPLHPYAPPVGWLRITGTSTSVFRKAWDIVQQMPHSVALNMIESVSDFLDDVENEDLRQDLMHLMGREKPHELEESWDSEVEAAYGGALSFIGGIWKAMNKRDPAGSVGRRVVVFPMLVPKRFVDMVEEQRPRALVILAHYFALLAMLRGLWWIGDSGPREVHAIADVIPEEWQSLLSWPRQILQDQVVFTNDRD